MDMVKVGDRVRVIKLNTVSKYAEEYLLHNEGIVTAVDGYHKVPIVVRFLDGTPAAAFGKTELEIIKPTNELNLLVNQVEQWSKDKGLDQAEPTKQFLKVSEEFGEIGAALARGNEADFKDAVGDTVVTLIILAQQKGYTLEECLRVAYDEIKGRQGVMKDGVFVKAEDLEGEPNADKQKL